VGYFFEIKFVVKNKKQKKILPFLEKTFKKLVANIQ
jgi:hypothetical protein